MVDLAAFPVLETERLILREVTEQDAEAIFRFRSDPVVQQYNDDPYTTLEQAYDLIAWMRDGFKAGNVLEWGLALKSSPQTVIGLCGFGYWDQAHRRAVLGYDLARDSWGTGLMPEAARRIIRFGFEEMDLNRIHADSSAENTAGIRVLEKLGFEREGVLHEHYYEHGQFHDEVLYALLRRSYTP